MEKIIFDTDIGSDIDDSLCLAYLLKQPACQLLGITTVSGEPVKRAMLASALCKAANKDIPIYPGIERPLLAPQRQPAAQQASALSKWKFEKDFEMNNAIDFMRSTIHKYPGEVTLLAVGPMTNVALLFSIEPEIPSLLKRLVVMCGAFTDSPTNYGPREWNAICDPHAAAIMYNTAVPECKSVGLDVTCQITINRSDFLHSFTSEIMKPVLDFAQVWFQEQEKITFHDPLAAAVIFNDKICGFEKGNISVNTDDGGMCGQTRWEPCVDGRHEAALSVDITAFFEEYMKFINA